MLAQGAYVGEGKVEEDGGAMIKKLKVRRMSGLRGLMFRRKPKIPIMIRLRPSKLGAKAIHTWFVSYSIDTAFISRNFRVIKKMTLKPFSMVKIPNFVRYVVEAPAGKLKLYRGDVVKFEEAKK